LILTKMQNSIIERAIVIAILKNCTSAYQYSKATGVMHEIWFTSWILFFSTCFFIIWLFLDTVFWKQVHACFHVSNLNFFIKSFTWFYPSFWFGQNTITWPYHYSWDFL
jgi:hypothetical protein